MTLLPNSKVLLTGGSGLLGRHLRIKADRPSHGELDITKPIEPGTYDLIIHSAGYTNVEKAEKDKGECFAVNISGTFNLLNAYSTTPFVYISSEYAYQPVNFYSLTKYLGEELVKRHDNYLIIRTLFKARPWKYPRAFVDQFTQGDYVDVIAPMIEDEIARWGGKGKRLVYVGTGRKTIYDLASQTRDVEPIVLKSIKGVRLPSDYQ